MARITPMRIMVLRQGSEILMARSEEVNKGSGLLVFLS